MNPITQKELSKLIRKAGLKQSKYHSSRIRGWGNSEEGVRISGLFPFKTTWQRNWTRHKETSKEPFHSAHIEYSTGTYRTQPDPTTLQENRRILANLLKDNNIWHEERENGFNIRIKNPFIN